LAVIARVAPESKPPKTTNGDWVSGFALFAYAIAFSLGYVSLNTGTGALILFGTVQVTMIGAALKSGEQLSLAQWLGLFAAISGFAYLALPGLSAPNTIGALLMCLAGIAWSIYSIRGKGVSAPVSMTAGNFLRSAPLALIAAAMAPNSARLESSGILLALLSGVVTSGLGYVFWYKALKGLTTTQASAAQLVVPILAALGGVAFLSERLSLRLSIASALILGGVAMTLWKTSRNSDVMKPCKAARKCATQTGAAIPLPATSPSRKNNSPLSKLATLR
jgi:drug/metabolite transporter (DMT)-like permease